MRCKKALAIYWFTSTGIKTHLADSAADRNASYSNAS